jgi:hypothetical protein
MKRFGILALALTMFTGAAAISFAQDTSAPKKAAKKKIRKKKSTGSKAT